MSLGKWFGVGAGWFLAGPIGAIIGYYIGRNFFDGKNDQAQAYELSLLILSSLVIKSDGKIVKAELDYVKRFFVDTFGANKANKYFAIFNKLNKQSTTGNHRQPQSTTINHNQPQAAAHTSGPESLGAHSS